MRRGDYPRSSNATIYESNVLSSYQFDVELLQADKDALDLADEALNKFYALIYKVGKIGTGTTEKTQYHIYIPGQISSTAAIDYSDFVRVGFTFKTLRNDADISIDVTDGLESESALVTELGKTTTVIPTGKQRLILEF